MPLTREDHRFPTRSYPYRRAGTAWPTLEAVEAGEVDGAPLAPGQLYAFVLGLDPAPRPIPAEEAAAALRDPFAELLLRRGVFPLTLRALLAALDATASDPQGLPQQQVFLAADGGRIPWTSDTAELNRLFRFVVVRLRDGDARLMVSASSVLDSETQFLQLIGWDPTNRVHHFYERRGGAWLWAGNSWHALREETRGRGPFDSHVNGALVMKELRPPWNNWHSMDAHITEAALAPDDPLRTEPLFLARDSAHRLEKEIVEPGIRRWNTARLDAAITTDADGDAVLADAPLLLRQVLETTAVNLASSNQQSARIDDDAELMLPPTFFVNTAALLDTLGLAPDIAPIRVPGRFYRASLARYDVALSDGVVSVPGDTFFAFLVPEPALEDLDVLAQLLRRRLLSERFAACLLMVDYPNPVCSMRRASLMAHVPSTVRAAPAGGAAGLGAELEARFVGSAEAAASAAGLGSPEAEFLALWRLPAAGWRPHFEARIAAYFARLGALAGTEEGFDGWVRLAESRRRAFRKRPIAEFRLTTPTTNIPPDAPSLTMAEDGTVRIAATPA
jgi:hypothetical protein